MSKITKLYLTTTGSKWEYKLSEYVLEIHSDTVADKFIIKYADGGTEYVNKKLLVSYTVYYEDHSSN